MWRTCFQSEPDCSILHHLCMFNPQHTVCNMVDRYNTGSLSYTDWASQCQLEQCHQNSYHYIQQMPGRSWRSPWEKPQALQWRYSSLCQDLVEKSATSPIPLLLRFLPLPHRGCTAAWQSHYQEEHIFFQHRAQNLTGASLVSALLTHWVR